MRRYMAAAAGVVMAGVLATGCRTRFFQVSVNPFFDATETPGDVTGRWIQEGEEAEGLDFVATDKNEWRVEIFEAKEGGEEQKTSGGVVRFGRVGEALYWDMTAVTSDSTGDLAKEHLLALHSVARVRLDGDTMELAFLDPQWVKKAIADGRIDLAHFRDGDEKGDHSVILTATTEELEAFLKTFGEVREVFAEPEIFHRAR